MSEPLSWDATYALAIELNRKHPNLNLDSVSLRQVFLYVINLPEFKDDPVLANEEILLEIYRIWYEEQNHDK